MISGEGPGKQWFKYDLMVIGQNIETLFKWSPWPLSGVRPGQRAYHRATGDCHKAMKKTAGMHCHLGAA